MPHSRGIAGHERGCRTALLLLHHKKIRTCGFHSHDEHTADDQHGRHFADSGSPPSGPPRTQCCLYAGYAGGLRSQTARELLATYPERVFESAIKGMLPKNRLARQVIKKLKVYAGSEHPHSGQNPQAFPSHV